MLSTKMIIRNMSFKVLRSRGLFFAFLAFSLLLNLQANAQRLSKQAKVSLLTYYPGEDLYSTFGHSAFWIYDPSRGMDRVYNYGTFDFRESNFYLKFIRGKLPYQISVSDINSELYAYQQ